MDSTAWVVVGLLALLVLAVVVVLVVRRRRRARLQERFGPEYDRAVAEGGSRKDAERDLADRAQRRDELDVRPLDPRRRDAFIERWQQVQLGFVDRPVEALGDAQRLVDEVMAERGYPVGDADRQERDLSADHADLLEKYRGARDVSQRAASGGATTEQLRRGVIDYRALVARLLADGDQPYPADGDGDRSRGRSTDRR